MTSTLGETGVAEGSWPVEPAPLWARPELDGFGILRFRGSWISLTPIQESILRHLSDRFGEPVSRSAIIGAVWPDKSSDSHVIDVHLARLRPRLQALGLVIHTIRGRGFLLEERAP